LRPQPSAGAPPGAQNKTVGIVGAGRIGAAYARMLAEGHKMDIVYFDPYPNKKLEEFIGEYGKLLESKGERAVTIEKLETVEDVLKRADVRGPPQPSSRCQPPNALLHHDCSALPDAKLWMQGLREPPGVAGIYSTMAAGVHVCNLAYSRPVRHVSAVISPHSYKWQYVHDYISWWHARLFPSTACGAAKPYAAAYSAPACSRAGGAAPPTRRGTRACRWSACTATWTRTRST